MWVKINEIFVCETNDIMRKISLASQNAHKRRKIHQFEYWIKHLRLWIVDSDSNQNDDKTRKDRYLRVLIDAFLVPFDIALGDFILFVVVCISERLESWGHLELVIVNQNSELWLQIWVLKLLYYSSSLSRCEPWAWPFVKYLHSFICHSLNRK